MGEAIGRAILLFLIIVLGGLSAYGGLIGLFVSLLRPYSALRGSIIGLLASVFLIGGLFSYGTIQGWGWEFELVVFGGAFILIHSLIVGGLTAMGMKFLFERD